MFAVFLACLQSEAWSAYPVASAPLRLTWEIERNEFSTTHPDGRSRVVLSLTNLDTKPLPAAGWAIYFTCVAGVEPTDDKAPVRFEQVNGTLFRMRPAGSFAALGAGQTIRLPFYHPEVMSKTDKAPASPYFVSDIAPAVGQPIADYRIIPSTRAEQLDRGSPKRPARVTPQDTFERNRAIADVAVDELPPVFPTPRQYARVPGSLRLSSMPEVTGATSLAEEVALAKSILKPYFASAQASASVPPLRLTTRQIAGQSSAEAYELDVDPVKGIELAGNSAAGVARGLQSLRELLPVSQEPAAGVMLPALRIVDSPRFEHRGLLLDVARNFQSKETVFRLLDLMARYKLNKFHFHLTDDEGWRIEIAGLPELTSYGARRGHSANASQHLPPAHGSGPDVQDPHGSGFYRRADYIEILKYAHARHIEVIPEIEMPGHSRAAVKAMESRFLNLQQAGRQDAKQFLLNDPADRSAYRSAQLHTDNVMNPGMPSTYAFIEHVVGEVVAMHKEAGVGLRTIHVGADELPNGAWEKSPASRALMTRLKLSSTAALWDHYYDRVDQILRKYGVVASGWEELGTRKVLKLGKERVEPNPVFRGRGFDLYVWNNLDESADLAYRLANGGYQVVLAPATNLYFDMAHNQNPEEPGVNWAAYADLDAVFDFIPFDSVRKTVTDATRVAGMEGLTEQGRNNIRGIEATLFTEVMREPSRIDYLLMPRMLALAERAWAPDPAWTRETDPGKAAALHARAWSGFVNQLGKQVLPRLDRDLPKLHYRIPPPGLRLVDGKVEANHQLPGMTLRYSADGSDPGPGSPVVNGPIAARGLISVAAFDRNGRQGRAARMENR